MDSGVDPALDGDHRRTIYFARVPILLHGLDWRSLAVFLPALVTTSLVTSLIVAVPSVWLPFRTNTKWWSWVINLAVSAILFAVLMPIAIRILKSWQRVTMRNTEDQILGVACCLIIFQLGLLALHLRGYRWKHLIATDPRNDSQTQYKFDYSLRWLTGVSIVLAVLTKFGVQHYENKQQESSKKALNMIEEVRADGADVVLSVGPNQPLYTENQIIQLSMTASNFEKVIPKLPQPLRPDTIQLEGMTAEQLSYVIRKIDNVFCLNFKNCRLTATNFTEFDRFPKIYAVQIEDCQFSFDELTTFLNSRSRLNSVTLVNANLTDDQFDQLNCSSVVGWKLAGNQLTDKTLTKLWNNSKISWIDFSRNPVTATGLSQLPARTPWVSFEANEIPLDDKIALALAKSGSIESLILGKTSVTPAGLDSLISSGMNVTLAEGSFDEEQLASINPNCTPNQWLRLTGKSFTGNFLKSWSRVPQICLSGTSVTDETLIEIAPKIAPTGYISVQDTQISDASLPALQRIAPHLLELQNSRVTAEGLLKHPMPKTVIFIDASQATSEQHLKLKSLYIGVHVR